MLHKLSDYARLFRLAKKRGCSSQDYLRFESCQARMVLDSLEKKGIRLEGMDVLEVGSGRGGYSLEFLKRGAKVTAVDITDKLFQKIKGVNFVLADASKLPFKDNTFDFTFCSSAIEHMKDQQGALKELYRVTKWDCFCYLSFPPFWSPVGAHQFKPFHYLGERAAISLSRKFYKVRSNRYNDEHGELYLTTIRKVRSMIKNAKFAVKATSARFMPVNVARIPVINEILTWNVEFLLIKKQG